MKYHSKQLSFSYHFLIIFLSFSYHFLIIFLSFSDHFLIIFLSFSYHFLNPFLSAFCVALSFLIFGVGFAQALTVSPRIYTLHPPLFSIPSSRFSYHFLKFREIEIHFS